LTVVDFIDEHRDVYGVEPICTQLQFAPSTYYAVKSRPPAARTLSDEKTDSPQDLVAFFDR
jgi:putative transposase